MLRKGIPLNRLLLRWNNSDKALVNNRSLIFLVKNITARAVTNFKYQLNYKLRQLSIKLYYFRACLVSS